MRMDTSGSSPDTQTGKFNKFILQLLFLQIKMFSTICIMSFFSIPRTSVIDMQCHFTQSRLTRSLLKSHKLHINFKMGIIFFVFFVYFYIAKEYFCCSHMVLQLVYLTSYAARNGNWLHWNNLQQVEMDWRVVCAVVWSSLGQWTVETLELLLEESLASYATTARP